MSATGNSDKHCLEILCDLLSKATESANEVLDRHAQLRSELGIPENADDARTAIDTALQQLLDAREVGGKIDIGKIGPLFQLACALRINRTAHSMAQRNPFSGHAMLGVHLMGIWLGALSAVQWMDSDGVLALFKHLHRSELAAQDRATRPAKQEAKVNQLLKVLQRKIRASGKSLTDCANETIKSKSTGKSITSKRLIVAYLEPQFQEALQTVSDLWAEGDERPHNTMAADMTAAIFSNICDRTSLKMAKEELLKRLNELARENFPERRFGMKGVLKSG